MNLCNVFYYNCRPSLPSPCSHSFEDRQILLNIQIYNFPFSVHSAHACIDTTNQWSDLRERRGPHSIVMTLV